MILKLDIDWEIAYLVYGRRLLLMNIKQEQKQDLKVRPEYTQLGLYNIRIDPDRYEPRMDDNYKLHFDGGKVRKRPPCD